MPFRHYIKVQVPDNFDPKTDRVDPDNAYGAVLSEHFYTWSAHHSNPFQAIKEVASEDEWASVVSMLCDTPDWIAIAPSGTFLDDLLQEIAGHTNIVCQYVDGKGWRACKED